MARKKRGVPGINSSSTADIAFMLLIFFLITTSMDTDRGLARRLPPPPENKDQKDDDIIVNYMGFTVTFEDNLEPLLVRLHNEGKGWGIVAIEAAEED